MSPSSSAALSLKPSVEYLVLNLCALWKKQTTIRCRHLRDPGEHSALSVRFARPRATARFGVQLPGALPHRRAFVGREALR